jgi:hypothetical protein
MRMLLLKVCAGVLVLVPVGVVAMLSVLPPGVRSVPLWLWVFWFLLSVWCALDAPTRIESLLPPDRLHLVARYQRWAMFLAIVNVLCSISTLIYVGWWS